MKLGVWQDRFSLARLMHRDNRDENNNKKPPGALQ